MHWMIHFHCCQLHWLRYQHQPSEELLTYWVCLDVPTWPSRGWGCGGVGDVRVCLVWVIWKYEFVFLCVCLDRFRLMRNRIQDFKKMGKDNILGWDWSHHFSGISFIHALWISSPFTFVLSSKHTTGSEQVPIHLHPVTSLYPNTRYTPIMDTSSVHYWTFFAD